MKILKIGIFQEEDLSEELRVPVRSWATLDNSGQTGSSGEKYTVLLETIKTVFVG